MGSESHKLAMKEIEARRERAVLENERRQAEISGSIPRARQLQRLLANTGSSIVQAVSAGPERCQEKIAQIMRENLAARRELSDLLVQNGYREDYLDTHYTCEACGDTGYVEGKKCRCLRELTVKYNAIAFNETSHVTPASFQTFSLHYYSDQPDGSSPRQTMAAILDFCKAYAEGFSPHAPSVLMMGETGLGKTHLSLSIAGEVMRGGYSVLYVSAPDLFRKLQNEYYGKGEPGVDTLQTLMETRLIIIDDLGAEIENQFNVSTLYNIVNSRLNAGRPIIISTNLTPKELERRYTNRVASRLMTMYRCLRFVGRDVRQIKLRNNELS